ncbi:MAG: copper chaperone PCu(A)C [Alphaproteobacteria bacterium]|nr:copper chaperone PCu(A)C [Alphaproteobacteria bacterium]
MRVNRRSLLLVPLTLLTAPFGASAVRAHSYTFGKIEIGHPWAEPSTSDIAAVFMALANMADKPDRLAGAATPIANAVLFQDYGNRPVDAFVLPAKQPAALQPGGRRIVLQSIKRKLAVGDDFPLTLRFAAAGETTVMVLVERGPAEPTTPPAH